MTFSAGGAQLVEPSGRELLTSLCSSVLHYRKKKKRKGTSLFLYYFLAVQGEEFAILGSTQKSRMHKFKHLLSQFVKR